MRRVALRAVSGPMGKRVIVRANRGMTDGMELSASEEKLKRRATDMHEFNPMLGFRGVRLAVAFQKSLKWRRVRFLKGQLKLARALSV